MSCFHIFLNLFDWYICCGIQFLRVVPVALGITWWKLERASSSGGWLSMRGTLVRGAAVSSKNESILSIFESILSIVISNEEIWEAKIMFCSRCCVNWRLMSAKQFSICVSRAKFHGVVVAGGVEGGRYIVGLGCMITLFCGGKGSFEDLFFLGGRGIHESWDVFVIF